MVEPRATTVLERPANGPGRNGSHRPTAAQRAWLRRGLNEPGGKLPLFDEQGQRYDARTIRACLARGWAAPWTNNPIKPDWLICKLTESGRAVASPTGLARRAP